MQEAYESFKSLFYTPPVLSYPDFNKPFLVSTDALAKARGAILPHLDENGREREHLSNWPVAAKRPNALSADVVQFVEETIRWPFGPLAEILSDKGTLSTATASL